MKKREDFSQTEIPTSMTTREIEVKFKMWQKTIVKNMKETIPKKKKKTKKSH